MIITGGEHFVCRDGLNREWGRQVKAGALHHTGRSFARRYLHGDAPSAVLYQPLYVGRVRGFWRFAQVNKRCIHGLGIWVDPMSRGCGVAIDMVLCVLDVLPDVDSLRIIPLSRPGVAFVRRLTGAVRYRGVRVVST